MSGTVQSDPEVIQSDPERSKTDPNLLDAVYDLILENPNITTEELARVCDMTPDGVYYHTKRLREKGVLIREGGIAV